MKRKGRKLVWDRKVVGGKTHRFFELLVCRGWFDLICFTCGAQMADPSSSSSAVRDLAKAIETEPMATRMELMRTSTPTFLVRGSRSLL